MRWPANGPLLGMISHEYTLVRSSFAGTLPASQCQGLQSDPVRGGSRLRQTASDSGSLFLFDVPAPANVVLSTAVPAETSSAMNAAAEPPNRSITSPSASKMSAQSGPESVVLPRMF